LIKLTSRKVTYLYDLMDAAYDTKRIDETSRQLRHVPITERNGRGQEAIPMAPHEAERYKIRSGAERANSRLKEGFGVNNVMVKGHSKVIYTPIPAIRSRMSHFRLSRARLRKRIRRTAGATKTAIMWKCGMTPF
jgi:hypothetical protein